MRFATYSQETNHYMIPEPLITEDLQINTGPTSFSLVHETNDPPLNRNFQPSKELQALASGRRLLLHELPFPIERIHDHYLNGFIKYTKSITSNSHQHLCHRCGNEKTHLFASHYCAKCQQDCVYCRHCLTMGKTSECMPIMKWVGPTPEFGIRGRTLQWQGQLSEGQQQASEKIVAAVGKSANLLIWAVCIANNEYGKVKSPILLRFDRLLS